MFPSSTPRGATSLVPVLLFRDRLRSWVELIPIQQFGLGWPQQLVSSVWLKYYSDTTAYSDTIKLSVMWISVNTSNSTDLDLDYFFYQDSIIMLQNLDIMPPKPVRVLIH